MSAETPEVRRLSRIQSMITTKKRLLPCKSSCLKVKRNFYQVRLRKKECNVENIMRTDENPPEGFHELFPCCCCRCSVHFLGNIGVELKCPSIDEKPAEAVEVVTRSIGCVDGSLAMHRDGCMANVRLSFRSLVGLVDDTAFDPG